MSKKQPTRPVSTPAATPEEDLLNLNVEVLQAQATTFFETYQRYIVGGIAGILIIVFGVWAYKSLYQGPREDDAQKQISKAEAYFQQDSFALALKGATGQFVGLTDIAKKFGGTNAGNMANYYAGVSYLRLGQAAKAVDYLKAYNAGDQLTPAFKYGLLGDAYSEMNKMGDALDNYKYAATANPDEQFTPYYLYKLGLLQEQQNKLDDALATYTKIKNDFPRAPQATTIDAYIARVEAKKTK